MPEISVIVPVYKTEKYIRRCIDSILAQTFADFECIVIDDGSPDDCPVICDEYAEKDSRIIVIHQKNKGVSAARKAGLDIARGEWIGFVDSDDWLERDMIEKMYQKAVSENYDMIVCDYFYECDGISVLQKQDFNSFDKIIIIKNILSIKIKSVLWNKIVKKELLLQANFPEYNRSEDYVISIQNVYNAEKIGYLNIPLYHYCYNGESLSNNIQTKINGRIEENKNWCKVVNFLKEKYDNIKIFEPELSNHVNSFKVIYIKDRELRTRKELFNLYPESKFLQWLIIKYVKKTIKSIIRLSL